MTRSISIRSSLIRDLAVLVLLLGVGLVLATFIGARKVVRSLSEALMGQTLTVVEARLDTFFTEAEQQLLVARGQAESGGFDVGSEEFVETVARARALRDHRNLLLAPIIDASPQISSLMLADGDGREHMLLQTDDGWRNRCLSAETAGEARWYEWSGGEGPIERVESIEYDPRTRPWYRGAVERGDESVHWTEPYTFFTTKEPGITVSSVYDRGDGVERVIGFDVLLNDISDFTRSLEISDRGMAAVLTGDGRLIGLPGIAAFDDPSTRSMGYLKRANELGLELVDDAMVARSTRADAATFRFVSGGEAWWGCAQPYELTSERVLNVAILVPESDLLGDLLFLRLLIIGSVVAMLAVGIFRAVVVARHFSAPVEAIVEQSERITQGNLAAGAPIESPLTEIRQLVDAQEHMRQGIMARRKLAKVERDLDLAREIQRGLLPTAAPDVAGFEIAGWNKAADKTGGDFYDWLVLPDDRILVTLADVTGHGIGPALIVAVYRAYMRASAGFGSSELNDALAHINDLLYADIPANRFITTVIALIEPSTAEMTIVSAGHGPNLFYEATSGELHQWGADTVPLGVMEGLEFDGTRRVSLAVGDMLLLVTDGFFEWANADGELFGIARLEAFARDHQDLPAATFIQMLYEAVLEHAGGTEQADDLTALIVRRTGS